VSAVPVDVIRHLAIEWRREADVIDPPEAFAFNDEADAYRQHATELDEVADHYSAP